MVKIPPLDSETPQWHLAIALMLPEKKFYYRTAQFLDLHCDLPTEIFSFLRHITGSTTLFFGPETCGHFKKWFLKFGSRWYVKFGS